MVQSPLTTLSQETKMNLFYNAYEQTIYLFIIPQNNKNRSV